MQCFFFDLETRYYALNLSDKSIGLNIDQIRDLLNELMHDQLDKQEIVRDDINKCIHDFSKSKTHYNFSEIAQIVYKNLYSNYIIKILNKKSNITKE